MVDAQAANLQPLRSRALRSRALGGRCQGRGFATFCRFNHRRFSESDEADIHQVTVDWGDGQSEVLCTSDVNQVSDSFNAGRVYATPGLNDVAVTVAHAEDSDAED